MKDGYARVSTKPQGDSLETQREALKKAGCERVFEDTLSGARAARPGLDAALDFMRGDAVLVVTRLDRLGRTALDTLRTIERLAQQGVAVIVMKPELDTRTKEGRLVVTFMCGLAEFDRDLLIERTKEGVEDARAQGRVAGPKPKLDADHVRAVRAAVTGGKTVSSVARSFGVSRPTIYKALEGAK